MGKMNKNKNKEEKSKEEINKIKKEKKEKREKKMKMKENKDGENAENTVDNPDSEKKQKGTSVDQIKDVEILADMYRKCNSRGKRQRIRKRVKALGHSMDSLGRPKELNFGQVDKNMLQNKNPFLNKDKNSNLALN